MVIITLNIVEPTIKLIHVVKMKKIKFVIIAYTDVMLLFYHIIIQQALIVIELKILLRKLNGSVTNRENNTQ